MKVRLSLSHIMPTISSPSEGAKEGLLVTHDVETDLGKFRLESRIFDTRSYDEAVRRARAEILQLSLELSKAAD